MTLQLLWLEYREWRGRLDVVLRQVYRAGEQAFVDCAGPTVEATDRRTGELHEAKVLVGVLAASKHTFGDSASGASKKVQAEWTLVCLALNVKRLHTLQAA